MIVVAGPASPKLGKRVAELLECELAPLEWKRFPDGESYIRIPGDLKGESVVVVQSTSPPQDKRLMELFFILDLINELGAREVTVVI
ncbi:MAG: ribose-phosphate pyrophosphokinase-like domain-containing protein, partial [archaeon GB-1867-035]|nr:ribose-phosphate pyrophosphokinase-like domain-containing protein [Candidatus Culexmicrobium profundum]